MKKLTELEKAIRAVGSFIGMMAGPGSDMEGQWIIVKDAAQLVEAELTATDNTERGEICCETCAETQKGYDTNCFNWPECSLTYDKWEKGNNYGDLNKKLEK